MVSIELSYRRGIIEASEQRLYMSAPEYPFVISESLSLSCSVKSKEILFVRVRISCLRPSKFGRGMYSRFTNLLRTASSSYCGRFVAPMMRTLSSLFVLAPSSYTRNYVLTLLVLSCSPSFLEHKSESISSIKMTLGCLSLAIANNVFTNFSLSPTHLLVIEEALMLKNVAWASLAIARPIIVFPVPGGPNNRIPLGGARRPVKISGLSIGHTIISWIIFLANPNPAIYDHSIFLSFYTISDSIIWTNLASKLLYLGSMISSESLPTGSFNFPSSYFYFLKGGTNFLRIDVPLGRELAATN